MQQPFIKISDQAELNNVFTKSESEPVILFKHSNACPISTHAFRQMTELTENVYLIVVQEARALSKEVEEKTGIRHETPQAMILKAGQAAWHASHYDITAQDVATALSSNR